MDHKTRRYLFRGRVQGVGFRMTTRRLSRAFPVTGYVRNLPDGRVEVVAAGGEKDVTAFVGAIRREFDGYIEGADQEPVVPGDSPLDGFEIRY